MKCGATERSFLHGLHELVLLLQMQLYEPVHGPYHKALGCRHSDVAWQGTYDLGSFPGVVRGQAMMRIIQGAPLLAHLQVHGRREVFGVIWMAGGQQDLRNRLLACQLTMR